MKIKRLIGNKKFYKMVLVVAIPMMIQNGITNFVSLLDNIMVGQVGTEQMSGVAIVNQLLMVFNICIFGAVSGAGIFGAQFYGCGNHKGVRNAFRFKLLTCIGLLIIGLVVFITLDDNLISLYLHKSSEIGNIENTLYYAKEYLAVMLLGLLPFTISQSYSSTLRETGETILPMKAGIIAVLVNCLFNYILIFGSFGAPKLGVVGAAIATVLARFVEMGIIVIWTHRHQNQNKFIVDVYRDFKIPGALAGQITIKGMPLLVNEALWASGMAALMQCYSLRGLEVVAGLNISTTIANVFNIVFIAMGSAVAIIVGQLLGAGKMEEAKETDAKLIFFSVVSCIAIGLIMAIIAPFFPRMYNTTEDVKSLARNFILISALCMPLNAFTHAAYFTLRSGGKTWITFLFDSVFVWVVCVPVAYFLSRYTTLPIIPLYLACQLLEIIKCTIGYILVKKGVWIHKFVDEKA